MKLILDVSSVNHPLTGIGRYTLALVRGLGAIGDIDLRLLRHGEFISAADLAHCCEASPERTRSRREKLRAWLPNSLVLEPYRKLKAARLASRLDSQGSYVYHSPNFDLPPVKARSIVTLHDLSVFNFPQFHPRDRRQYLQKRIRESIDRADVLVTDSEYIRREVMQLFPVQPDRICTVPLGVDDRFGPTAGTANDCLYERLGLKYKSYTLCVGTIEPRKNVSGLLDAWMAVDRDLRQIYPLVLAGGYGWHSRETMGLIRRLCESGDVIYLDYVSEEDLPGLYAGASAFYYLSLYEGFGLPVLEAMKSGVPVVCSNISSLPEVGGESVLTVPPDDKEAIVGAMYKSLVDGEWRNFASRSGVERSATFTWDRTAEKMTSLYRQLAA